VNGPRKNSKPTGKPSARGRTTRRAASQRTVGRVREVDAATGLQIWYRCIRPRLSGELGTTVHDGEFEIPSKRLCQRVRADERTMSPTKRRDEDVWQEGPLRATPEEADDARMGLLQAVTCALRRHAWAPFEHTAEGLSRTCKHCGRRQFGNDPPDTWTGPPVWMKGPD
jgi:hypothetical protein